jgi:hypothetical protein
MKVKVTKTYIVSDDERLAIAHHYGLEGKANHETVRDYINQFGDDFTETAKKYYRAMADLFAEKAA